MDGRASSETDERHPNGVTLGRRKSFPSEWRTEMNQPLQRNQDIPPRRSQSETNLECNGIRGLVALESCYHQGSETNRTSSEESGDSLSLRTLDARYSTTSSLPVSTTESQTSGYTTESSYRTATGYARLSESSSYASIETHFGPPPSNFLREIHVAIDIPATEEEIQSIRQDLRDLLTNEITYISQNDEDVVYLIAYHYM